MQTINYPFGRLELGHHMDLLLNGKALESDLRRLRDIVPVLRNKEFAAKEDPERVLYRMYRSVTALPVHAEFFRMHSVRFDLTVMDACLLDREPNKTLGHLHPEARPGLSYPELYQVLYGRACYLLQRFQGRRVIDFVVNEAGPGDAVLIPPNYGHVTVNIGHTPLVMANLVSTQFSSIYGIYRELAGATYYLLDDGSLEPNPCYRDHPEPSRSDEKFPVCKDIYTDFLSCPNSFSFLNDPTRLPSRFCRAR
ncbi:MAG: glucose-6-phosphate isomerase family protein [Candidatus Verstraetearchaeota archaeon]|nr:glucose-6-phosphate isomerase family protein [Candidatus Verstraetearchaeota archaeon]